MIPVRHRHWCGTGSRPVSAVLTYRPSQPVVWLVTNVPLTGTGTCSFEIQAQITNNHLITQTVQYKRANVGPSGRMWYKYDSNGNRTEKWTNSLFAARYFYDTDNQLLGISFNNDQDCTDSGDYAYAYDPFGRRISATEDGVTRHFAYDGLDCIAELDSNANVNKWYLRAQSRVMH